MATARRRSSGPPRPRSAPGCGRRATTCSTRRSPRGPAARRGRPTSACRSPTWPTASWPRRPICASRGLVAPLVGHAGDGNFHLIFMLDPDDPEELARVSAANHRLVERALGYGGTCSGEHGVGLGKLKYVEQRTRRRPGRDARREACARPEGPDEPRQAGSRAVTPGHDVEEFLRALGITFTRHEHPPWPPSPRPSSTGPASTRCTARTCSCAIRRGPGTSWWCWQSLAAAISLRSVTCSASASWGSRHRSGCSRTSGSRRDRCRRSG